MRNVAEENLVTEERLSTTDFVMAGKNAEQREQRNEREQTTNGSQPQPQEQTSHEETPGPLLASDVINDLRNRWTDIQAGFVDEPRTAVKQADELVAQTMKRLAETFADQRNNLERQWTSGGDVSTEDLRQALRKYRSFFERLLSIQAPAA